MLRPLRISTAFFLGAAVILAVGLAALQLATDGPGREAYAHLIDEGGDTTNDLHASLDIDPWNGSGPCNPVDSAIELGAGDYDVAVCIESATSSVATFEFSVSYNDDFTSCVDVSCPSGDCLDDNPDANAGATLGSGSPTTPDLGSGWDCSILDSVEPSWQPTCHKGGEAKAWMACWSTTGPFTSQTGDVGFPLAIITFTPITEGTDSPALSGVILGREFGAEMGSCNPAQNVAISCFGATLDFCEGDADCDSVLDAADNCPAAYNPGQENSDGPCRPNGSQIDGDCASNPADDALGDACDIDADNDSLPSADENESSCPYRTIGDSDGDGPLDGYEVGQSKDPCNQAVRPYGCTSPFDTDGDGFSDCLEMTGYATCATTSDTFPSYTDCVDSTDSDGDGCPDWVEIVDINGTHTADLSDVVLVARRAFDILPPSDSDPLFDVNKDGVVNLSDAVLAARNSSLMKPNDCTGS